MPTTLYDASTIVNAIAGRRDLETAGRIYIGASNGCVRLSLTGTEAKLTFSRSTSSPANGMIEVSVDGGAYAAASRSDSVYTLFTGLSDAEHIVLVRVQAAYSMQVYLPTTGNVLEVTGASPVVGSLPHSWYYFGSDSAKHKSAGSKSAQAAGIVPTNFVANDRYVASIYIAGDLQKLWIVTTAGKVYVSEDGVIVEYTSPFAGGNVHIYEVACSSGSHEYLIWTAQVSAAFPFGVGAFAEPSNLPTLTRRLYQFGDSITEGPGSNRGLVDVFPVAQHFRMAGATFGISGSSIAQLLSRLDSDIASASINSDDVAVLAIGRNNVTVMEQAEQDDFVAILNKLVAAGFAKIVVRGLLQTTTFSAFNDTMESLVTAYANPNVVYVDMESLTIDYIDGTHPSAAGFTTMATFEKTAYLPHFGVWNEKSTSKSFAITNAQPSDAGTYRCTVTDSSNMSVVSDSVTLTVA